MMGFGHTEWFTGQFTCPRLCERKNDEWPQFTRGGLSIHPDWISILIYVRIAYKRRWYTRTAFCVPPLISILQANLSRRWKKNPLRNEFAISSLLLYSSRGWKKSPRSFVHFRSKKFIWKRIFPRTEPLQTFLCGSKIFLSSMLCVYCYAVLCCVWLDGWRNRHQ